MKIRKGEVIRMKARKGRVIKMRDRKRDNKEGKKEAIKIKKQNKNKKRKNW